MKKNVIALLLAVVMAWGSIGSAPALAAETMELESVAVEEPTEETPAETVETNEDAPKGESVENIEEDPEQGSTGSAEESATETTEGTEMSEDAWEDDTSDIADTSIEMAEAEEPAVTEEEVIESEAKKATLAESEEIVYSGSCGEDLTWMLDAKGTLTISGVGDRYSVQYGNTASIPWYEYKEEITNVVIESGVTSIGDGLFQYCKNIKSVIIPNSVTRIGSHAFDSCTRLTDIIIPNSVTSIESDAFEKCQSLESIIIPSSVISLGSHLFYECSNLKNVSLPEGLRGLPQQTFYGCSSLSSVIIPSNYEYIGRASFYRCSSLSSITIPEKITNIYDNAFVNCESLSSVYFAGNAPEISRQAFYYIKTTAYYPANDATWTDSKRRDYGGIITWVPWNPNNGIELIEPNTIVYYKDGRHIVTPGYSLDDCLTNNSTDYNPRLAYLLIALATSAYQDKEPFTPLHPTEGVYEGEFPDKPLAVTESLKNLGFSADNIIEEQYYTDAFDPSYNEDSTAYTIATKPLSTGEEIVTIVVRGSYGGFDLFDYSKWSNDWKGNTNFKNYDRGLHEGFSIAANKIYERLESFLSEKSINKNNVKYVITGHSRGAAVANLVSKKLIDKGIPTDKVYDYNFACPDSGRDYDGEWNRDNKYGGMFNINNVKDIIGVIPGALFLSTLNTTSFFTGFFDRLLSFNFNYDVLFWGKYGTTYFFSNEWTALTDTVFGDPNVEHQPTTYLNYLSDKPSNSSFKSWLEARAIFTSNVTGITELGKVLGIFCPVNTEIYDSNGSIIAKVTDGEQYYYNDSFGQVVIITAGDQCLIYIKGKDDYSIKMEGTDEGTLDFFVADAISPENEEHIITFENISLEQGKVINSIIHAEESVEKTALYIIDENGNPIKEILHDGTEELINTIGKMNISGISSKVYTGKALKQELTITHNDVILQENTDYTVKYENNINVGIAKVIITGIGSYSGTIEKEFEITPKNVTPAITLSADSFTYSGQSQKPILVSVKDGDKALTDADFDITWPEECINSGTYEVAVTLKGNYSGSGKAVFTIKKAAQTVTAKPWLDELGVNLSTSCTVDGIGRITYTSSNPSVVTVDGYGWLTGCAEGTAIITVTANGDENHLSGQTTFEITVKSIYAVTSGPCGENATWTYYNNGTVEINGTGKIELRKNSSGDYLWDSFYTDDPVWDYKKVVTVIINEGITEIGGEFFSERSSYGYGVMSDSPTTVIIADSVNTIYKWAFINCSKLERVSIGSGLTTLENCVFTYCPSLKDISVSENNNLFTTYDGALYSKDLKTLYKLPNDGRTEFSISQATVTIKEDALGDLEHLSKLTIPKSVKVLEDYALDGCNKLKDIYYEGSSAEWKALTIGTHNNVLETANIHYAENDKSIEDCTLTLSNTSYVYDGKAKKPEVIIVDGTKTLEEGVDYQIAFANNTDAGTATITITGIGAYIGTVEQVFEITPKAIIPTVTLSQTSFTYNGKAQKPSVTVSYNGKQLKEGTDYNLAYKNNVEPGTASVIVTCIGNYSGSVTKEFTINKEKVLTGAWKKTSSGWWYDYGDGSYPKSKFENISGKTYYFNSSGYMVTGWQNIGGAWYYFSGSGAMATGWQSIGGKWYYMSGSGVMRTGLQNISGKTYYFSAGGAMLTGWQKINNKWYYFSGSGAMLTGWQKISNKWYYFDANGAMLTGWQSIGGKWYYFEGSGVMAANKWVGNYYLTASGAMATNTWIGKYYVGADGKWIPNYKATN